MINARPNINGNSAEDFSQAGRDIFALAGDLKQKLVNARAELLNGRNYNSVQDALKREADHRRLNSYLEALIAIEGFAVDLHHAAQGEDA